MVLHTPSITSAMAVALCEPKMKLAGLLHFLAPDSRLDQQRGTSRPALFGDTGIELLLHRVVSLGAETKHLHAYLVGGADLIHHQAENDFALGQHNAAVAVQLIEDAGIHIAASRLGGVRARRIAIEVKTGIVRIIETPRARESA